MNPRVINVKPNKDYTLSLEFSNHECKIFDVKPYLELGIFNELKDLNVFMAVKSALGTVCWPNEIDLCPDTLYLDSKSF